jgi:acetate kinase
MGTRSGDLDPALIFHLVREHAMPLPKVEALLTRESGLKGLCGSGDMREILGRLAAGDDSARLALDLYCYRIRKYIGAYSAALGGIDALAFTAGIGENAPEVRARACAGLAHLGVRIDPDRNRLARGDISPIHAGDSTVAVLVIRANEEFEIARQVRELVDTAVSQGNEP